MIYKDAKIIDSDINPNSTIGNLSRVYNSKIMDFARIDRNNLIMSSNIGKYSYTGNFTVIQSTSVGNFCSISWGVSIGGGEHSYNHFTTHDVLYNRRYGISISDSIEDRRYKKKCEIGNDVWIGANSVILRDVIIENGAVIGAGSVVTKSVPPYAIVAGNPAQIIKFRFSENIIDRLIKIAWWNLDIKTLEVIIHKCKSSDIEKFIDTIESL